MDGGVLRAAEMSGWGAWGSRVSLLSLMFHFHLNTKHVANIVWYKCKSIWEEKGHVWAKLSQSKKIKKFPKMNKSKGNISIIEATIALPKTCKLQNQVERKD